MLRLLWPILVTVSLGLALRYLPPHVRRLVQLVHANADTLKGIEALVRLCLWTVAGLGCVESFLRTRPWDSEEVRSLPGPLLTLAAISLTCIILGLIAWGALARGGHSAVGQALLRGTLMGTAALSVVTSLAFAYTAAANLQATPQPTVPPTPTSPPSPTPLPRCHSVGGEWPCLVEVLNTEPRDTLCEVTRRGYDIRGTVDPLLCQYVCEANREMIDRQFYENVPPNERAWWRNDPCNYVLPGNLIVIPFPPALPTALPTP